MRKAVVEALETRVLFAGVAPDAFDQYLIALVNRARQDPMAEAARLGIALNEGVPSAELITTAPKQPLAPNFFLEASAEGHAAWMMANSTFSHTGVNGSNGYERDLAAGYTFGLSFSWGENLGLRGVRNGALPDKLATLNAMYEGLFIDAGIDGRGHRLNILRDYFREVGAGIVSGVYQNDGPINAWMLVNEFASNDGNVFLTGIVYSDTITRDSFYTPGEGFGNVTVEAQSLSTGAIYTTTSWDAGGYSLQLQPDSYAVRAYGGDLVEPISRGTITIGGENVLVDLDMTAAARGPRIVGGVLQIFGLPTNDTIRLYDAGDRIRIYWNQGTYEVSRNLVNLIEIHSGSGDDYVEIGTGLPMSGVYGDAGNDTIYGGSGTDFINGNDGDDYLVGRYGDDSLAGNAGNDVLAGKAGQDTLFGGLGNDTLRGGNHNDLLYGGDAADSLVGGEGDDTLNGRGGADSLVGLAGNDVLLAIDGIADSIDGGDGYDRAAVDSLLDTRINIEL